MYIISWRLDLRSSQLSFDILKASFRLYSLLRCLTVAAHELINTSSGVDELALTSIERVRGAGDFYFYHRVSFAFEFYCIIRLCCRLREEHIAVGHVLKHDGAIVFGMNTFFHFEFNINNVNCSNSHFGLQRYEYFSDYTNFSSLFCFSLKKIWWFGKNTLSL